MQDLANGHLDVKALGEAANGDENTIVTTRTGNTYPSAERAINIMFQNGGLPAMPFKTKALMTASALANDKYAMVTDDTVNNGLYVKTAGAWVKSGYDPLTQAKVYTQDSLIDFKGGVGNDVFTIASKIDGAYISSTGIQKSAVGWVCSGFLPVTKEQRINYSAHGATASSVIAGYNANNVFLRTLTAAGTSLPSKVQGDIYIPDDIAFVRVSAVSGAETPYSFTLYPISIDINLLKELGFSDVVWADINKADSLFDANTATASAYLATNVVKTSATWFYSGYIPVKPETAYITNGSSGGNLETTGVHYYNADKTLLSVGAKQLANVPFSTPPNAAFMRINYVVAESPAIEKVAVNEGTVVDGDSKIERVVKSVASIDVQVAHRYNGKKLMTMGDSITDSATTAYTYPPKVAAYFGMSLFDVAISGTRVRSSFAKTAVATDVNILASNIITIAHGTNDYKIETPLGTIADVATTRATLNDATYRSNTTKTGTFYADYKGVIESILTINPNARIMLITPIKRTAKAANGTDTNSLGLKLIDYVNAVKAIAEYYSLPILDNYLTSGFNTITLANWSADGLHPNKWAQDNIMVNKIIGFIESN